MRQRGGWRRVLFGWLALLVLGGTRAEAQPPRQPELWAIAVGVGTNGPADARGARQVLEWLQRAGWDDRHRLLLSDFGADEPGNPDDPAPNIRPTRGNLDWAFRRWLPARAKAGDFLVFYFAGRAGAVVSPQGPRQDPRVDYQLVAADTRPDDLGASGWPLDRALDDVARGRVRVVCWLATTMGPGGPSGVAATPMGLDWLRRLSRWPGVAAWLASDRSPVGPDSGDRFTRALIGALGEPGHGLGRNLAACLEDLHQDPELSRQGFRAMGGVPTSLDLRKERFGRSDAVGDPELVLQLGHGDVVTALAATADGRLAFSASQDSTVRVWSTSDGSMARAIPTATAEVGVTAMAMSQGDRWLIRGGGRGLVTIHDRERNWKTPLIPRQPHSQRIVRVVAMPDGDHFVTIDRGNRAFLWDLRETSQAPKPWLESVRDVARGGRAPSGGIVVAWTADGRLKRCDPSGTPRDNLDVPPGRLSAVAVATDGRSLAMGFDDGRVVVREGLDVGSAPRSTEYRADDRPSRVRRLTFSAAGALAVEHDRGLSLIVVGSGGRTIGLVDRPIQAMAFAPGGGYLAATTEGIGALRAWRLGAGALEPILDDPKASASAVGFTGDHRSLLVGGFGGSVTMRNIEARGGPVAWSMPGVAGKIQAVAASPNGRHLLLIDRKGTLRQARIWDLSDRDCRRIPGTWAAGAFLDDDHLVLVADPNMKGLAGRLVRVDRRDPRIDANAFRRDAAAFRVPEGLGFERVSVSPDGRRVAAASDASKTPMVGVWRVDDGRLSHWIAEDALEDPVLALVFSADGESLLTAGESPTAKLWDLSAGEGPLREPVVRFADPAVTREITCAAIRQGASRQVVTGHNDGQVHLWSWSAGKATLEVAGLAQGEFTGAVKALAFSSDGRHLAAAGDATSIWVGAMESRPHAVETLDGLRPHHSEQIHALATWKNSPILISGGDDATIRFWDIEKGALRGTFATTTGAGGGVDWVFSTPTGLYDAPPSSTRLIRFRRQDDPIGAAPFESTRRVFQLADRLLDGRDAGPTPTAAEPSPIAIAAPPRFDPSLPTTRLSIAMAAVGLRDVRLYQNDVPIPCPAPSSSFEVVARLVPGRNRFHVMAGRNGAFDASSNIVDVDYEARPARGQVHVLAIGIGGYRDRPMPHAADDARRLAAAIHARSRDAGGKPGLSIVIDDDRVTEEAIDDAFDRIARRVEDRPQDTVVVFLSGRAAVFADPIGFCLLRSSYPVAGAARNAPADPALVVPYATIAASLSRLGALQRVVIVEAGGAGAILEDRRALAIQRWLEASAHRVRTSYILSTSNEEAAATAGMPGYGPLAHALLRGMRAIEPMPKEILGLRPDADANGDGLLSTVELDTYARDLLARLAPGRPKAGPPVRSAETSFILVPLR